jgi:DNA-binding Lrp family transcriptional regulator
MKNEKRNDFMYYVSEYKAGNPDVLNDLIKFKPVTLSYGKQKYKVKRIDYINDSIMDNFFRTQIDLYQGSIGIDDTTQLFIEHLIKALNSVNLFDDANGREYSNNEVITYVKTIIKDRLYDVWFELEGQFRADLDIKDEDLTWENFGTKHIIHVPEVVGYKSDNPNDEDLSDLTSVDLYSKQIYETFEVPNKIRGFLDLVDVKRVLNNDKYYELYKLLLDDVSAQNDIVLEKHTVRHLAEKLNISKTALQERLKKIKELLTVEYEAYLEYRDNRFTGLTRKILEFIDKYDLLVTYFNKMSSNDKEKVKMLWDFTIDWLRNEYEFEVHMQYDIGEKEIDQMHKNKREQVDSIFTLLSDNMRVAESSKKLFKVLRYEDAEIGMRTQQKTGIMNQVVMVFRQYLKDAHSSLLDFREYEKFRGNVS